MKRMALECSVKNINFSQHLSLNLSHSRAYMAWQRHGELGYTVRAISAFLSAAIRMNQGESFTGNCHLQLMLVA